MRKSRISAFKQGKLLEFFVAEVTARNAAKILGVNTKTAAYFYLRLRKIIFECTSCERIRFLEGKIELDESYFGGKRKGKRGRGAAGKTPVFGLLKRGGKVYAEVIKDTKSKSLIPIIKDKICPQSIVYTDTYSSYNALTAEGFKHHRINHNKEFAIKSNHINGIENFWNQAKRHLRKFNGIPKENFYLYLRECEWRFNQNCPKLRLAILSKWVKKSGL